MNKFYGLLTFLFFSAITNAQNIIQYGKYSVSKDEFIRAFTKNKTQITDKEKAVREYVDLYANFKLKVRAAEDMRVDTSYQQITDLENFRKQIEGNYLNDETTVKKMHQEALERSRTDLHLMLYSVSFGSETSPSDTLKLLQTLQTLKQEIASNSLTPVAEGIAQKDMGYITVFSLPYRYESMAYSLNPGQTSEVFRNKKGWHFFKLIDTRKAMGKWRIAQIMLCYPPDADFATKGQIQSSADSIYQLIKSGSEFSAMARATSEDRMTAPNGGEIAEFGTGKFDAVFMNEVTKLKSDGDLSAPFATSYGVHIIKRIGYTPLPDSITDELLQYEIRQKLMQDARLKASRESFAKDIMKKVGCKPSKAWNEQELLRFADSVVVHADDETYCDNTPISQKVILQIASEQIKGKEWLRYIRDARLSPELHQNENNQEMLQKYPAVASLNYYRAHLETYNADFAFQLKEFKEGNMLFDVMEKMVWSKAANDSVGLLGYYNQHKDQYTWNESVDALVFNCNSPAVANEVQQKLKEGIEWRRVLAMKQDEVQGDSGRFEMTQIGLGETAGSISGKFSDITVNQDGTATFMQYLGMHPKNEIRSFEQAKGLVINDYQAVLEQKWLEELRKKYPIKTNEAVIKAVIKQL